jgi:hypothetical protein
MTANHCMKKKSLNFIVPLVIYPFDVMVSLGEKDEDVIKRLKKTNVQESEFHLIEMDGKPGQGRAVIFDCGASIIRLWNYPTYAEDYGSLAHEIFHIVSFVMYKIGQPLEVRVSDESYAYLIGYLTKEIYKKINNA